MIRRTACAADACGQLAARLKKAKAIRPATDSWCEIASNASRDGVVASIGTSNFCTEASDSPSRARIDEPTWSSLQDTFLAGSLSLSFGKRVPGIAIHGFQPDHILCAQAGDRSFQESFRAGAHADLTCIAWWSATHAKTRCFRKAA